MSPRTKITLLVVSCLFVLLTSEKSVTATAPPLPNPVLVFSGFAEPYTANGQNFLRYSYSVENFQAYPNELFAPAPGLPPCGTNKNSSRTWVDFFDLRGKRLYGFCALGKPADLNGIWFSLPDGEIPPSWVYIEMTDRQTNTKYKSNLAETVQ